MNTPVKSLCALLALSIASCDAPQEEGDTTTTGGELITPIAGRVTLWTNNVVNICIEAISGATVADVQEAKLQAMTAIQNGWERAGKIHFDFRCRSTRERAVLQLNPVLNLGGGGKSNLGMPTCDASMSRCDPRVIRVDFCAASLPNANCTTWNNRKLDKNEKLRSLVLHEVGHALGFVHEHKRKPTPADVEVWCAAAQPAERAKNDVDNGYEPFGGDTRGTPYDHDSIMQYCRDINRDRKGDELWDIVADRLSEGDKLGMRNTYGAPAPKTFPQETLYKIGNEATVYLLRNNVACHLTWPQFVDIGQPVVTGITQAEGQFIRDRYKGALCSKSIAGSMPDDFYQQQGVATVYRLNGQQACAVTWDQFVRLGQPAFTVLTPADGQRFRDAYGGSSLCTNSQVGL